MKIKRVAAKNVKGRTFDHELQSVSVIVGNSFGGKTAILDAIKLGLLGWHPKYGRKPSGSFRLASGTSMNVLLETDDNETINRAWKLSGNSVKVTGPESEVVPALLLDCREYFGMTGPQRMAYLFSKIDAGDKTETDGKLLKLVRSIKPKEETEHTQAAIQECVDIIIEQNKARDIEEASTQQWMEAIVAEIKEKKTEADALVKQMAGLTQGTVQLDQGEILRDVQPELIKLREQLAKANDELTKMRAIRDGAENVKKTIDALKQSVKHGQDSAARKLQLQKNLECLDHPGTAPDIQPLLEAKTAAAASVRDLAAEIDRAEKSFATAKQKLADAMSKECCPFCKSKAKGWRKEIEAEYQGQMDDTAADLKKLEEKFRAADLFSKESSKAHMDFQKKLEAWRMKAGEAASIESEIRRLEPHITNGNTSQERLDELTAGQPAQFDAAAMNEVADRINDLRMQISDAEDRQKQFLANQGKQQQAAQGVEKLQKEQARAEVMKMAGKATAEFQSEMIDGAIGGLMGVANQFCEGVVSWRLSYRDGEIGYATEAGSWVPNDCFSGAEEALCYAAMAVALANTAKCKIVMIDELGIIDPETKAKLLNRMMELEGSGVIDQFVGCDVTAQGVGGIVPKSSIIKV